LVKLKHNIDYLIGITNLGGVRVGGDHDTVVLTVRTVLLAESSRSLRMGTRQSLIELLRDIGHNRVEQTRYRLADDAKLVTLART